MEENSDKKSSNQYHLQFGQITVDKRFITKGQLKEGLIEQIKDSLANKPRRLIGEFFFDKGWVTRQQITMVLNKLFLKE